MSAAGVLRWGAERIRALGDDDVQA
jgi:hypothetical protein